MRDLPLKSKIQILYYCGPDKLAEKISEKAPVRVERGIFAGFNALGYIPSKIKNAASFIVNKDYINACIKTGQLNLQNSRAGFRPAEEHNYCDYRLNTNRQSLDNMISYAESSGKLLRELGENDSENYNHLVSAFVRNGQSNHLRLFVENVDGLRVVDALYKKQPQMVDYKLVFG